MTCTSLGSIFFLTVRKLSLGQGNVFKSISHSVHRGLHPGVWQTQPLDTMGYGQQMGSMHPTGMHSCFHVVFVEKGSNNRLVHPLLGLLHPILEILDRSL